MLQQSALPFRYQASTTGGATALVERQLYPELASTTDLRQLVANHLLPRAGEQDWSDGDVVTPPVLLSLAGDERVADLELRSHDEGFSNLACAMGVRRPAASSWMR